MGAGCHQIGTKSRPQRPEGQTLKIKTQNKKHKLQLLPQPTLPALHLKKQLRMKIIFTRRQQGKKKLHPVSYLSLYIYIYIYIYGVHLSDQHHHFMFHFMLYALHLGVLNDTSINKVLSKHFN